MRWRNRRSSWWGFHPYLLQPISCRNGPPGRLCFLLPAIQMTHVQSPVSEIDQGEIQTEIFAPKAPPSPLPPGCPSVRSAEKDSSGRKPPHEQIVPPNSLNATSAGKDGGGAALISASPGGAADPPSRARSQPSLILTLTCNLLIASPFAPKKFLKQFTAFLGEHPAVDVAAMI